MEISSFLELRNELDKQLASLKVLYEHKAFTVYREQFDEIYNIIVEIKLDVEEMMISKVSTKLSPSFSRQINSLLERTIVSLGQFTSQPDLVNLKKYHDLLIRIQNYLEKYLVKNRAESDGGDKRDINEKDKQFFLFLNRLENEFNKKMEELIGRYNSQVELNMTSITNAVDMINVERKKIIDIGKEAKELSVRASNDNRSNINTREKILEIHNGIIQKSREIEQYRNDAERLKNDIDKKNMFFAEKAVNEGFGVIYDEEIKAANTYREWALYLFGFELIFAAGFVSYIYYFYAKNINETIAPQLVISSLSFGVIMLTFIAYLVKISSNHRLLANWARQRQLEVETFNEFVSQYDDKDLRNRLKEKFAHKIYCTPSSLKQGGGDDLMFVAMAEKLVEMNKKQK